jgi:hypothetical protein
VLDLGMTFQAKVRVCLNQQLAVYRAVRVMTNRAAFAQSLVFEDMRSGLLTMTLSATFVSLRHRQAAFGLKDVPTMRVMALDTIYPSFNHRVVLRQIELRFRLKMALKARGGVFSRVNDKLSASSATLNMFATRAMT